MSDGVAVAAYVGAEPITVAAVEERLAAMRSGPYAARLPHPGSAEGRNLRRWLVQLLATTAVLDQEAARLGLPAGGAPTSSGAAPRRRPAAASAPGAAAPSGPAPPAAGPPDLARALRLGGVAASAAAAHPGVYAAVTAAVTVDEAQARDYWGRNRDRHPGPFPSCRAEIEDLLLRAARDRHFTRWLDGRCAELVRLSPGFEHPGDPAQPDHTHHH
ncbi:hypothetical protein [Dactylosporangium sp. NPDC051541]|uniref:DUF7158 domain-containing protein n=1 Tax=Dactylosporangium sp. NPDC051541 TaxID=3363977 RepID=UPI00378B8D7B